MVNLYPHEMNCSVFVGVLFITWNTKYNTRTKVSFCPLTPWVWHKISNVYNAPVYSPRVKFEAFWGHTQLINMKLLLTAALWKNTRLTTHNGRSLWVLRSVYFQLNQHFTIKINYKTKFRSLFDFSLFYSCFFFNTKKNKRKDESMVVRLQLRDIAETKLFRKPCWETKPTPIRELFVVVAHAVEDGCKDLNARNLLTLPKLTRWFRCCLTLLCWCWCWA